MDQQALAKKDSDSSDMCDWLGTVGSSFGSASKLSVNVEPSAKQKANSKRKQTGAPQSREVKPKKADPGQHPAASCSIGQSRRWQQCLVQVQSMDECAQKAGHIVELAKSNFKALNTQQVQNISSLIGKRLALRLACCVSCESRNILVRF
jgi:hypothetical protein